MIDLQRLKCAAIIILVWILVINTGTYAKDDGSKNEALTKEEFAKFLKEYQQFKADYQNVKRENEALKRELAEVKSGLSALQQRTNEAKVQRVMAQERAAVLKRVTQDTDDRYESLLPGITNFALGGGLSTVFQNRENVDSTFGVGVAPILLWKPTERLLLETEVAFALTEDETEVELDYAHVSYILNDYMTIGAGKFLMPFNTFWERWHPSWINKLPTIPLIYETGMMGQTGLGVQLRGVFPIGPTKLNYSAYVVNGPEFRTTFASAGQLGFNNFRDSNNNKAFGGRIGFLPIPELELGGSFMAGRVGESGTQYDGVDTTIFGADLMYSREFDAIKGRLDLRAEYICSNTDNVIFVGPFDPFTLDNKRDGWFVQAAYRPTKVDIKLGDNIEVKNFEFIVRYDQIRQPGADRLGLDRTQVTFGVDYWFLPNAAIKAAYVLDEASSGVPDQDAVFLQFAIGL
ncbi:MAG: porin [Planctomycetota bacterium]|jgi:hypothetical protein